MDCDNCENFKPKTEMTREMAPPKLEWMPSSEQKMTWDEAGKWAEKQGGRLPTLGELLIAWEMKIPGFKTTYYWSSTTYASSTTLAWIVSFSGGFAYGTYKAGANYVRCVRLGQ